MKFRYILAAISICALTAAAFFWLGQAPLSRGSAPAGYVYDGIRIVDSETGDEVAFDEHDPFGDMFAAMAAEMAAAIENGVLMVDPGTGKATLLVQGTKAVAPLPEPGQEVPFDTGTSGSAPIFLSRSPETDSFTLRAPESAMEAGVDFMVTFIRSQGDIQNRISAQDALQAARAAALRQWNGDMDRLQAELAKGPVAAAETYRLNLPGDFATIAVPLSAGFDDSTDNGQPGVVDRLTGKTLFNLRLDTAQTLKQALAAQREEIAHPDDDTRLLYENDHILILARRDASFQLFGTAIPGAAGYAIYGEAGDLTGLQTVWNAVESISDRRPDPGIVASADFDALAWFGDRGVDLAARAGFGAPFDDSFAEQLSKALVTDRLISGQSGIRGDIALRERDRIDDPLATLFQVNYACLPRPSADESPVALQAALSTNPFSDGLGHRDIYLDEVGARIAKDAKGVAGDHAFNPETDMPVRQPPIWAWQSPTGAFGADNLSYFAYRVRDLDVRLQLVCATSSENPYAALAGLQILNNQPLPDLSGLPPLASEMFGHYNSAHAIGDGLYKVRETRDGGHLLIDAMGKSLSDTPFDSSWNYPTHGVFETTDENGKSALWSYSGQQLLPYEYDDFDDAPDGIIQARKGEETLFYAVAQRRFVPRP